MGSIVAGVLAGLASLRIGVGRSLAVFAGIFALGCLCSAVAPTMGLLLSGRVLQGLGGGALMALSHVAVTKGFPERNWTSLFALISGVWGLSSLAGPLIGGLFAEAGWWRGAFLVFAGKGLLIALAAPWMLSRMGLSSRMNRSPGALGSHRVPWHSLTLLTLGVLAVAAAGVVPSVWAGFGLVAVGLTLLLSMLRAEILASGSLLPSAGLRTSPAVRSGLAMTLLLSVSTIAFLIYGPFLLETFYGIGALRAGYFVASESIAWTLAALAVGRVQPEGEPLYLRLGPVTVFCGLLGIAVFLPLGPSWMVLPWVAMQGAGYGLAYAFIVRRVVTAAPEGEREQAAGAVAAVQMLGYSLGAAIAGIAINSQGLEPMGDKAQSAIAVQGLFAAFIPFAALAIFAGRRLAALPSKAIA
ncbi:MAG: MFS transporter [Rhodospirillales bacterium]|nr:MFS transporter [Rhodospirillales bacterium]